MYTDTGKKIIDIGEVGNASTGDILYDGGKKINTNFDALYNAFADQRLFPQLGGENSQKIHATSYYQKVKFGDANATGIIPLGSCIDVDCSEGAVMLQLPRGKVGEAIFVVNSNGSASKQAAIKIVTNGSGGMVDTFRLGGRELVITSPNCRIELWCVGTKVSGEGIWDYSITSMFGRSITSVESTYSIGATPFNIRLGYNDDYATVKLLLSFSASTSTGQTAKRQSSEVILMIDPTIVSGSPNGRVFSTEYAVVRNGESTEDEQLFSAVYSINAQKDVVMTVSTKFINARLAVKVIETQAIEVAQ